ALATGRAGEVRRLRRRELALLALSGVALAGHFAFWVASLQRTSIVAGVVLVTMQPLFVGLGAWVALRERPTRRLVAGVLLGGAGALVLAGADLGDRGSLIGDLMALVGAVMASVYLVIGRGARARLSTPAYAAVVYTVTALTLLALVAATRTPIGGHPREAYVFIALLALGPQLVGHNAFNWALGSLPAAVVAVAILGEPVGATLIAAALLGEVPTLLQAVGAAVVLAGVYVALSERRRAPAAAGPSAEPIEI
ncbi:MAG: DMT family transporter, partial [Chloroflexi bacterium]|nr:DMT family transporter [Chloroflexota bacterium]